MALGTMTFGNQTGAEDAFRQMDMALAAGITLFDVAEMYPVNPVREATRGVSETILGDWIAARGLAGRIEVATKVTGPGSTIRGGEGYDGAIITREIDQSLRRLRVDTLDLYQLHWPRRGSYAFRQNWRYTPVKQDAVQVAADMRDCVAALDAAQKAGKIRAWGLSNESAWGMIRWADTARAMGAAAPVSVQNEYSLLYRAYDLDLAEAAHHEGFTLLAYSPLAAGLLTGKYAGGATPAGSRRAVDMDHGGKGDLGGRYTERAHAAVAAYAGLAADQGRSLTDLALAFVRARRFDVIPILGATSAAQLAVQLAHLDSGWSEALERAVVDLHKAHPMPF